VYGEGNKGHSTDTLYAQTREAINRDAGFATEHKLKAHI
jgi:hypothetical protein